MRRGAPIDAVTGNPRPRSVAAVTAPTVRCRVVMSGHVQGVWFRESCRCVADARGVAGWVANRPDGTVEAVFEGSKSAVAQVVAWCRVGPSQALVTGLALIEEEPEGLTGFRVR